MVESRAKDWPTNLRLEGRQQGEAMMLTRQLEHRFGPLDESIRQRIVATNPDILLDWAERVFTASSIEEVVA